MGKERIIIGTRGSKLALVQTEIVKSLLQKSNPDLTIDIRIIKTKGDIILDTPLAKIGDKGLFTKEIEQELLNGKIDLAVHSVKDLPTKLTPGLTIGAVLKREDPRDAFVSLKYRSFKELPAGAVVATSSLRRKANVLMHRPDIKLVDIRGNVETRLRKLIANDYDGMFLAVAGLVRMGYIDEITEIIDPEIMLPAVAQGALGVEVRKDDETILSLVKPLTDEETRLAVMAERAFLKELEGGCQVPIGALAVVHGNELLLKGIVSDLDGGLNFKGEIRGISEQAEQLGQQLGQQLLEHGAKIILDKIYREQRK